MFVFSADLTRQPRRAGLLCAIGLSGNRRFSIRPADGNTRAPSLCNPHRTAHQMPRAEYLASLGDGPSRLLRRRTGCRRHRPSCPNSARSFARIYDRRREPIRIDVVRRGWRNSRRRSGCPNPAKTSSNLRRATGVSPNGRLSRSPTGLHRPHGDGTGVICGEPKGGGRNLIDYLVIEVA
jgi:hypothetical protein